MHPLVEAITPQNETRAPWFIDLPYGNDTEKLRHTIAHDWVNSPNIRGTLDIIQSCVLTLIACIYTALHLNVPFNSAWYSVSWIKLSWVLLALFAPEIVVFMAAKQLQEAWRLRRALKELQQTSATVPKDRNFDLTYCFFVIMGGVRVDIDDMLSIEDLSTYKSEPFLQMHPRSARLSAEGVIKLAKRGHWIHIPKSKIADKSKANYVQKALVFIQVSWMVGQCIARKLNNLPLTILEVHTMVHVVCAIFLYVCWLKKPLDVQDPEVLSSERIKGEIAAMVQGHFYSEWGTKLVMIPPQTVSTMYCRDIRWRHPDPGAVLVSGDALTFGLVFYGDEDPASHMHTLTITPKFVKRWEYICATYDYDERSALSSEPSVSLEDVEMAKGYQRLEDDNDGVLLLSRLNLFVSDHEPFKIDRENFDFGETFGWSYGLLLFVLPGIYGGVHLTAWSWKFPTLLEALMWKVSCIIIAAGFPTAMLIWGALYTVRIRNTMMLLLFMVLGLIIYLLARFYIIVESFLSLRRAPVGVYVSLEWAELFPHF